MVHLKKKFKLHFCQMLVSLKMTTTEIETSRPSIEPQSKIKYGISNSVRVKYLVGANNAKSRQVHFTRTQKLKSQVGSGEKTHPYLS